MVYTELLDYGGDEIYFKKDPRLAGKSFADALLAYDTSAVIGVKSPKGGVRASIRRWTRCFGAGDQPSSSPTTTTRSSCRGPGAPQPDAIR